MSKNDKYFSESSAKKHYQHTRIFRVALSILTGIAGTVLLTLAVVAYILEPSWVSVVLVAAGICNFAVFFLSIWDRYGPAWPTIPSRYPYQNTGMDKEGVPPT